MTNITSPTPLAIIIVSWNVKDFLDACLLSLREELGRENITASVWVIDNASQDATPTMLQSQHPWVNTLISKENLGYVRANNHIIQNLLQQTSPPDYIWLLNPDTLIQPDSIRIMLDFFAEHPHAGIIGPQLQNPDGSLQPGAFRFPGIGQPLFDFGWLPQRFYYTHWNGRYPTTSYTATHPFRIDHPLGAAMMVRTAAIENVGLLDENFFMYCEEIDWAWRMRKAGWESWLVPQAKITHHGGASSKQAQAHTTTYLWESRARLYRKHRGALTNTIVKRLVQRTFSQKNAPSPDWEKTYQHILKAWSEN